ncbi:MULTISPECIES: alpha/beta fold hydrolase [Thermomonospora]|jgi:pimeloyl-ACP methyl ester carboxylesterase|uniref:Alpha/beta hydrolase fold protein n=1 Tax=Thermomonospora curvata (strain ATCC 19995 / DSM 43183 / JCM 3096 / KCTC 9072 / NBRC 15933 / NCIMB 10081 / Henssen B9) TaxID=471852 RepID=D1ABB9_THECD|nr:MULTISPECIES: alpha/beta hydrolase [Thermomonospora]ACY97155.1 alpha/beta hydrolase fold protein [Thermomonospora curvata DSM 43183]PKK15017.1 MAG: alpha/beta hydrolase [Thermomonospora sp. CIF 1]
MDTIKANGLEFGYLAQGPADGPLALCLHGFPDSAHTWRHLLPALAAAGYRAVAPFMRGYAPTSVPADGAYQTGALGADANALHEALGGGPDAVLIGHDWGAAATYAAIAQAPERWRRAVTLALPPVPALLAGFLTYEQLKRSFYIFVFQTPLAEMALNRSFVEGLWRDWSPGYDAAEDVEHVMECLATPDNIAAAIGYYRAMLDPSRHLPAYAAAQEAAERRGERPIRYLHGTGDGCLGADITGGAAGVLPHLPPGSQVDFVEGAGHFLHLERPDEVNALILDWLSR